MSNTYDYWKATFYAGPYVPSGVIYGKFGSASFCHWLVPGFDPDPPIHKMDLYKCSKCDMKES